MVAFTGRKVGGDRQSGFRAPAILLFRRDTPPTMCKHSWEQQARRWGSSKRCSARREENKKAGGKMGWRWWSGPRHLVMCTHWLSLRTSARRAWTFRRWPILQTPLWWRTRDFLSAARRRAKAGHLRVDSIYATGQDSLKYLHAIFFPSALLVAGWFILVMGAE